MSQIKREILDVQINDYIDFDVIEYKTFDEVIAQMESLKKEYKGRDIYFYVQSYGYDGGKELRLYERRLETDKEYAKRCKTIELEKEKQAQSKKSKEEKERATYERLRKKFESA
jgi:hypothetical protein